MKAIADLIQEWADARRACVRSHQEMNDAGQRLADALEESGPVQVGNVVYMSEDGRLKVRNPVPEWPVPDGTEVIARS